VKATEKLIKSGRAADGRDSIADSFPTLLP
jgi:hypothetical protein